MERDQPGVNRAQPIERREQPVVSRARQAVGRDGPAGCRDQPTENVTPVQGWECRQTRKGIKSSWHKNLVGLQLNSTKRTPPGAGGWSILFTTLPRIMRNLRLGGRLF